MSKVITGDELPEIYIVSYDLAYQHRVNKGGTR